MKFEFIIEIVVQQPVKERAAKYSGILLFFIRLIVSLLIHHYTSAHGSGRRYYILLLKFLSFFSPRWLYRQGTFLAQMVGYRCNFKNWVQNLGGDPH